MIIKGIKIVNPDEKPFVADIFIENGIIKDIGTFDFADSAIIDGTGLCASPGFIDIHCHLRDPGFTYKEDIVSGAKAAAAGGFTTICCMPNTAPALDSAEQIKYVLDKAKDCNITVLPIAAATKGLLGTELTDFSELLCAGACAFSDDGRPITDNFLMKTAIISAAEHCAALISHCEMLDLSAGGAINEGEISKKLGVKGVPASAEEIMISRDIILAEETGRAIHIAHVSTAAGVRMVRDAKSRGVKVTAETCPHYFALTEEAVLQKGVNAKMSPPLRLESDRKAVIEGLKDGTIDAIVTDHAPHSKEEKDRGLETAPNGIIGFETAFALSYEYLVKTGEISLSKLISLLTLGPAKCLGLEKGEIKQGDKADIVIYDLKSSYIFDKSRIKSKSENTPFIGETMTGEIKFLIANGRSIL